MDLDLTINVPDASPVVTRVLTGPNDQIEPGALTEGPGYHPAGHPRLRSAPARVLTTHGLGTSTEQIVVTTGAQQAIALAIRGLCRDGGTVGVEETTYPGALDVIAASGLKASPLAMTPGGVSLSSVHATIRDQAPRLLYLIPSFHNPTSTLLSDEDRRRLVKIIATERVTTIDDMTLGDLDFGDRHPTPLAAFDAAAPIVTVGSKSKVYWGGLRIGWIRANPTIISHLAGLKVAADMGSSSPTQVMATAMLDHHDEARTWRHDQIRRSLESLSEALDRYLPEWQWARPEGGPQLWVRLPETDATAFAQRALRRGIALVPGPLLAASGGIETDRLRIPLYPRPEALERAAKSLAAIWNYGHRPEPTRGKPGSTHTPLRSASTGSSEAARSDG